MLRKRVGSIWLLLIVVVSLGVAMFQLGEVPPSLNWDETALGYNAYSLMLTGRDEFGKRLPLALRSFDDYKPALSAYLIVPFMKVFGRSQLSVRLPFAILGGLSVVWFYVLGKELFGDKRVGYVAAVFSIFEMWHLQISHGAFEAGVGLFFFLGGVWALFKSKKKPGFIFVSVLLGVLACYSYHSFRLVVPILWGAWVLVDTKTYFKEKRRVLSAVGMAVVLLLPLIFTFGEVKARFGETNIFAFWPKTNLLSGVLGEESLSFFNLGANPVYYFVWEVVGRWWSYFSLENLVVRGEVTSGFYVPTLGIFYVWEVPLFLVGIYWLFKRVKSKEVMVWVVLGALPAVVTLRWFHLLRAVSLWPVYTLLIALGAVVVWDKWKGKRWGKWGLAGLVSVALGFVAYGLETYFVYLPRAASGDWQYGFSEMVPYVANVESNYEKVVVDSSHQQPQIFFLFYQGYSPKVYHEELAKKGGVEKPRKNFDFGKYEFRDIYWPEDRKIGGTLWVGSVDALPSQDIAMGEAEILQDFYDLNGNVVFRVVETK